MIFSVETPLASTDWLLVEFPFLLHSTISAANVPGEVTATVGALDTSNCPAVGLTTTTLSEYDLVEASTLYASTIYSSTTTSLLYYISLSSIGSISANTDYVLTLSTSVLVSVGLLNKQYFLKFSSVAAKPDAIVIASNILVYDSNPLFSTFTIVADSTETLVASHEVNSSVQTNMLAVYEVFVDIYNSLATD